MGFTKHLKEVKARDYIAFYMNYQAKYGSKLTTGFSSLETRKSEQTKTTIKVRAIGKTGEILFYSRNTGQKDKYNEVFYVHEKLFDDTDLVPKVKDEVHVNFETMLIECNKIYGD